MQKYVQHVRQAGARPLLNKIPNCKRFQVTTAQKQTQLMKCLKSTPGVGVSAFTELNKIMLFFSFSDLAAVAE